MPDEECWSAVVVLVPDVEAVVGAHRDRLDPAASWGVPAHVTVLFPFLHPDSLDAEALATLGAVLGGIPAFDCTFDGVGWFGRDVAWLRPDALASAAFAAATRAVWAAFPDHPPYAGVHGDEVVPHLTIGDARALGVEAVQAAASELAAELPLSCRVTEAVVMVGREAPASCRVVARFPLCPTQARPAG